MDQKSNIAILILAAGESSRMGDRVKQLLPWKKSTLLQNTIQQANASEAAETYIVLGANQNEIQNALNLKSTNIIQNKNWKSGMGTSIVAGINHFDLHHKKYDAIVIMLADQPFIDAAYLNEMIVLWKNNTTSIVTTKYKNKAGVPAIFGASYHSILENLNKDFGAKEVIHQQKDAILVINPKGKEIDIDTWQEYQELIKTSNTNK